MYTILQLVGLLGYADKMTKPGCDVVRTWEKLLCTIGDLYHEQLPNDLEYTNLLVKLWPLLKGKEEKMMLG